MAPADATVVFRTIAATARDSVSFAHVLYPITIYDLTHSTNPTTSIPSDASITASHQRLIGAVSTTRAVMAVVFRAGLVTSLGPC